MLYFQWIVSAILMLFPITFLFVPRGESTNLYLLILCALVAFGWRLKPLGKSFSQFVREYWPISISMAGLAIAILINHLINGSLASRAYEMPLQLACFSLLSWMLLLIPTKSLKNIQWSVVAGTLTCVAILYVDTASGSIRALSSLKVPLIPFGNIAILMGFFAMLSIGWNSSNDKMAIVVKVVAGVGALYGSYLSQSRGGWIALPLLLIIAVSVFRTIPRQLKLGLLLAAISLVLGLYVGSGTVQNRIDGASSDIQQYINGEDRNTSVGIRLQLWEASWVLFKENPIVGIGRDRYAEAVDKLAKQGVITPQAAWHPHPHNDLFFGMATLGISGLLSMLFLYFIPAVYFFRDVRSTDRETRTTAGMGLALCLGYFVFGLTDVMFYWRVSYSFYVIFLALFFAILIKRKAFLISQK